MADGEAVAVKSERPVVTPPLVNVACQIADRIEQLPWYALPEARRENSGGWTVCLRGCRCRGDVRLTDEQLHQAPLIARRMVVARCIGC